MFAGVCDASNARAEKLTAQSKHHHSAVAAEGVAKGVVELQKKFKRHRVEMEAQRKQELQAAEKAAMEVALFGGVEVKVGVSCCQLLWTMQ